MVAVKTSNTKWSYRKEEKYQSNDFSFNLELEKAEQIRAKGNKQKEIF